MTNKELLKEVVESWEILPEGHYQPEQISYWLLNIMKPTIDKCRKQLKGDGNG